MDYEKYVKGGIWWSKQSCVKTDRDSYLPMIIVSEASDPCGKCSVTVVPVKPVSVINQNELNLQYAVPINLNGAGYIMCNELKTLSTDRLETYEGQCTDDVMNKLNKMISQYLQLSLLGKVSVMASEEIIVPEEKITENPEVKEEKEVTKSKKERAKERTLNFKKDIPEELDLNSLNKQDNLLNNKDKSITYTIPEDIDKNSVKKENTQYKPKNTKAKGRGPRNGTPIYCLTTHKWYVSMYEAMKATGVDSRTIKAHLDKGDTSEIKGYAFSYEKPAMKTS